MPTPTPTLAGVSTIDVLVVAGGGAGGNANSVRASPGGAGGVIYIAGFPVSAGFYSITVAGTAPLDTQGSDSILSGNGRTLKALGGGFGKWYHDQGPANPGGSGASGWYTRGGGLPTGPYPGGIATQPSATSDGISVWPGTGYGNAGGIASDSAQPYSGGGGGAGGAGGNFDGSNGAVGGIGKEFDISGVATYYAGGGGAACFTGSCRYAGGLGGGGRGDNSGSNSDRHGVANTGGGGGAGGTGGSGIVILRYSDIFNDLSLVSSGLTFSLSRQGGYKIYSFTAGSGSIVFALDPNGPTPQPTVAVPVALPYTITASAPTWGGSYFFSNIQAQDQNCWIGPDGGGGYPNSGNPNFFFVLDTGAVNVITSIVVRQCARWCQSDGYGVGTLQVTASTNGVTYGSAATANVVMCTNSNYPQPLQTLPLTGLTGRYVRVLVQTYNRQSTGADYIGLIGYAA